MNSANDHMPARFAPWFWPRAWYGVINQNGKLLTETITHTARDSWKSLCTLYACGDLTREEMADLGYKVKRLNLILYTDHDQ